MRHSEQTTPRGQTKPAADDLPSEFGNAVQTILAHRPKDEVMAERVMASVDRLEAKLVAPIKERLGLRS